MLAGQIVAKGKVELVEISEPDLGDVNESGEGDIIFQPDLAWRGGWDMPFFKGEESEYPLEVGYSLHEMIGTVVDTNGRRFTRGDKVLAVPIRQRGFFERYSVSESRTIPLDPRCPPPHALMAQPLGTVLFGLRKIPHLLGLNVAVVGQGPIGQLFCAALRNVGAREIIALDRIEERLKVSAAMGATKTINVDREDALAVVARVTRDTMADVVIEAVSIFVLISAGTQAAFSTSAYRTRSSMGWNGVR
jgi:threonine dehydrogenase-like Zn-dependent dehydrogenase